MANPIPCWCGHQKNVHIKRLNGACEGCGCHKYRAQRAKPAEASGRSDDRRESDRHPPRPL